MPSINHSNIPVGGQASVDLHILGDCKPAPGIGPHVPGHEAAGENADHLLDIAVRNLSPDQRLLAYVFGLSKAP